jgi:ERCC4-related helicase
VPLSEIHELTGDLHKSKRIEMYKKKRVFFMTPQTLEKDIEN